MKNQKAHITKKGKYHSQHKNRDCDILNTR